MLRLAPVMMIDNKVYGKVKKSEIADILSKYIKRNSLMAKLNRMIWKIKQGFEEGD